MVWERPLQHSLRPVRGGAGLTGGFVMPYQAVLHELERNADLDPLDYIAFAPEDSARSFHTAASRSRTAQLPLLSFRHGRPLREQPTS